MAREKLVLLPGMMCDARLFAPQVEVFSDRYQVIVGDLTGADTIEALAHNVLEMAGEEPFNLAGLSMGGIVAMAVAHMAPDRVMRLALLDTNHLADPPERRAIRDAQVEKVMDGQLRDVIIDEMKPNYLAAAHRGDQDLLDMLVTMAMDLGADAFLSQTRALMKRPDQTEALKTYDGPSLVLCGAEDTLCPPQRHREMAALLPDADLVLVPDAGHISTLENPADVNAAFLTWLDKPLAPAGGGTDLV